MIDLHTRLQMLERPALLVRTARHGLERYRRPRDLRRALRQRGEPLPGPAAAVMALLEREKGLERARVAGDPRYTHARHIEVLIALMGESRLLRTPA
ncbi:hypothetical protein BCF33_0794 [Hasllibacter halocynthiae]|uniref:Uncharacterized protein n=1 Tax=Hasllibacter halocynthiae TaxID=595589 RepID=A0A2T0X8A2_9RHOB|nr:DUF6477 family protein [Hasllibacter halocynthiae]PRY95180.1 hypothetical protein BCF33_0794 [Hasllibacter halocynthiae]